MKPKQILFATTNQGKLKEVRDIFNQYNIDVRSLSDFTQIAEPIENGKTFWENALFKAKYYSENLRIPCLTDDSGLCVEALNGEPGVFSARYAITSNGIHDDKANIQKLLKNLQNIQNRQACFKCSMVYYDCEKIIELHTEGILNGRIIDEERGTEGFGYDPIFIPNGYEITLAQMVSSEKNKISHRYQALAKMIEKLLINKLLS